MITCRFDDGVEVSLRHVCIDALVVNSDSILLAKRSLKVGTEPGKYCIPGGYLDRGETTLEGIRREVLEETGYRVHDGLLFHIRDYPDDIADHNRQNIAFTYMFTDAKEETSAKLDWDSDKPRWVPFSEIDDLKASIAFDHWHIIKAYIDYLKKPQPLPIWNACILYIK